MLRILLIALLLAAPALAAPSDDEVMAAVSARHGKKVEKRWVCLERPAEFPGLVVIGMFAHDRGCALEGLYFDGQYLDVSPATARVLQSAGWKTPKERPRLAKAWANHVLFAWQTPLESATEYFGRTDTRPFTPPGTVLGKDGGVTYTVWVQNPSGMRPEVSYRHMRLHFTAEGAVDAIEVLDRFSSPLKGH